MHENGQKRVLDYNEVDKARLEFVDATTKSRSTNRNRDRGGETGNYPSGYLCTQFTASTACRNALRTKFLLMVLPPTDDA